MTLIGAIGTALPQHGYTSKDILRQASVWLGDKQDEYALFERFISSSKIANRYFAIPLEEVLALTSIEERVKVFQKQGVILGKQAVEECLVRNGIDRKDINAVVFTSCSVPVIPSIDAGLIQALELPLDIVRVPIYQHGCAGGAAGLSIARHLSESLGNVLLVSVELCSLVYQSGDLSGGNLVGSAIFGDGAAAALISPGEKGFQFIASRSHLIPDSTDLMGYDLSSQGNHLRLKKELPGELAARAPDLIRTFLKDHGIASGDVPWWLIHPGGVKILNLLQDKFHLADGQARWAWDILAQYGNMSSASIFFVMKKFLEDKTYKEGDKTLVIGIGPGLTLELILFECRS